MNLMTLRLTPYSGEYAENDVLNALTNAKDLDNNSLFAPNGVQRGVDAELLDNLFNKPDEEVCPLVMLQTWQTQERSAQGGGRINTDYVMSLYFLYYFGVPSQSPVAITYVQQRRRHLTAAMKAIEMQTGGNATATIPVSPHWKWDTSKQTFFDFLTPFETFGTQIVIKPSDGYNAVRVDRPISIWH